MANNNSLNNRNSNQLSNTLNKINSNANRNGKRYLEVKFGDLIIEMGKQYPLSQVALEPTYEWKNKNSNNQNSFYTLVVVDRDAPQLPNNNSKNPVWIHQVLYNIPDLKFNEGNTFYSWVKPSPPPELGTHRYYVVLYLQEGKIEEELDLQNNKAKRWFGRYKEFTNKIPTGLKPMGYTYFECNGNNV